MASLVKAKLLLSHEAERLAKVGNACCGAAQKWTGSATLVGNASFWFILYSGH
jgi:hypothetical protein